MIANSKPNYKLSPEIILAIEKARERISSGKYFTEEEARIRLKL